MALSVVDVRTAIVGLLNTPINAQPAFSPIATAIPIYDVAYNLNQLSGGRLVVVPNKRVDGPSTRSGPERREITIDIAVQFKYSAPTIALLDPYMREAEAIADYLEEMPDISVGGLYPGVTGCSVIKVDHPHLWVDKHIREFGVFTSVVSATVLQGQ